MTLIRRIEQIALSRTTTFLLATSFGLLGWTTLGYPVEDLPMRDGLVVLSWAALVAGYGAVLFADTLPIVHTSMGIIVMIYSFSRGSMFAWQAIQDHGVPGFVGETNATWVWAAFFFGGFAFWGMAHQGIRGAEREGASATVDEER